MIVFSFFNTALPFGLFSYAAQYLPAGYLSVLNATAPLQGLVLGVFLYNASHNYKTWIGLFIGIFGVFSLTSLGPVEMNKNVIIALVAGLIGAYCYAITGFWTYRWFKNDNLSSLAMQNQLTSFLILLPTLAIPYKYQITNISSLTVSILLLGLLCTGIAYILYFKVLNDIGPIQTSSVAFLIPCFTIVWSFLFLDESLNIGHLIGIVSIILSVKLIQSK